MCSSSQSRLFLSSFLFPHPSACSFFLHFTSYFLLLFFFLSPSIHISSFLISVSFYFFLFSSSIFLHLFQALLLIPHHHHHHHHHDHHLHHISHHHHHRLPGLQGTPKVDTQFMLAKAGTEAVVKTAEQLQKKPEPDATVFVTR